MNTRDFLQHLLPAAGFYFTGTFTDAGRWRNTAHRTLDAAASHLASLSAQGKHAYFALASYHQASYVDANNKTRRRTQINTRALKSFFLDLDVGDDPLKFASKEEAAKALQAFVAKTGLPKPMVVDSGGGLHCYWPLTDEVLTEHWRPVANQLKALCTREGFRVDKAVPADPARVLRPVGTNNAKHNLPVQLVRPCAPVSFVDFAFRLQAAAGEAPAPAKPLTAAAPADPFEDGNLGATNDPVNFDHIVFLCPQLQNQVATRGAGVSEPLWRAGLGVAKFAINPELAWRSISDGHPDYDEARTREKVDNWHASPTACAHFESLDPKTCAGCDKRGTIKSPVVLARAVMAAPPPVVESFDVQTGETVETQLPDTPRGYKRRASDGSIVQETEDKDGNPVYLEICPYDLYPVALRDQVSQSGDTTSHAQWRIHLPVGPNKPREPHDMTIPAGALADAKNLHKFLLEKGAFMTVDQAKATQSYMIAYLKLLAQTAARERIYDHLGWQDDRKAFVLGETVWFKDGSRKQQPMHPSVASTIGAHGLKPTGSLEGWKRAMAFYNRPGYEGHRFFLYAALGAPIFHMNDTGNKGVLLTASGKSGRGKTTVLRACASFYGHPDTLLMNGNKDGATTNAMYATLGAMHSLPYLLDDTTERDHDEMRRFLLNLSTGQGKRRMGRDGVAADHLTWETLVLSSSNADDVSALLAGARDNSPHMMRMISVEFAAIDTSPTAKIAADEFLRALVANHGHVGPILAQALVTQYDVIRARYIKNVEKVDRMLASDNASAERFWGAAVAAAYTGAQLAQHLGFLDYPVEADLQWMIDHIRSQRSNMIESVSTPREQLTMFLNGAQRHTLIMSSKNSSNLDNVAQRPTDALWVRHEIDTNLIYVDRSAMGEYCNEQHIAFKPLQKALLAEGVLLDASRQKTLGAETVYARGQTRCWLVDATKLEGLSSAPPAPAVPSNVTPLRKLLP